MCRKPLHCAVFLENLLGQKIRELGCVARVRCDIKTEMMSMLSLVSTAASMGMGK